MPIQALEEILKTLTYHQALVLYWTCKDLKYEDIAERYNYKKSWCVWQMSFVYQKLGLDQKDTTTGQSLHWNQRREIIKGEVCPALMRLINNDLKNIDAFPLVAEGVVVDPLSEVQPPPPESQEPPQLPQGPLPDPASAPPADFYPVELYNAWLMVLEDERTGNPPPLPPDPPIVITSETRGPRWGRLLVLGVIILLGCSVVGVLAYWFGQQNVPTPPPVLASATHAILATETLAGTATVTATSPPTETLVPPMTATPTSTLTPIPTDTKSPNGLAVGDALEDGRVTLRLTKVGYNEKYDRLGARVAPISYYFDFTNNSGETIVLQFDTFDFKLIDDIGSEANCWFYHISGAGEAVNEPLNNGATREIIARCGLGQLDPAVNTFTLTVFPFSSLPESTWVVEIPR